MRHLSDRQKIGLLFVISVIVYGVFVSFFTSTVYVNADEELYISLARSFHYNGRFEVMGELANYNCVLYSVLISAAYFFYTPQTILLLLRLMGVVMMCSSIFPIWLLAGKILQDRRKAVLVSGFCMLLPSMFDCVYMIQEVLSYPLFLWTLYFIYRSYEQADEKIQLKWSTWSAVFSVLCFFTKTYLFFIPVTYNLCILLAMKGRERKAELFKKLCAYDLVYLASAAALYVGIEGINRFQEGSNHYASQFSWLFPITGWTVASGVVCCVVYGALVILNMGVLPLPAIFLHRKKARRKERLFIDFILGSCLFLVFEIVFLIVLTEEGVPTVPHKFLFRYFQVLTVPVLLLFYKIEEEEKYWEKKGMWVVTGVSVIIAAVYFACMGGETRQSIADGFLYLTVENITKYIVPYGDVLITLALGAVLLCLVKKCAKTGRSVHMVWVRLGCAAVIVMWLVNGIQLPVYTNEIADGRTIQSDSIIIADYLNENGYDFVYYLVQEEKDADEYDRNLYGYIKQPYQVIMVEELGEVLDRADENRRAFVLSSTEAPDIEELDRIDLPTVRLRLYLER